MARLPTVGGDSGTWGTVLNDYLQGGTVNDGSLSWRLDGTHSVGSTTLTYKTAPKAVGANLGFVIIDPFTTEAEIRQVAGVSGSTMSVAATTYAHADGDVVFWFTGGLVPWQWWGGKGTGSTGDATTNVTAFNRLGQQLLDLGSSYGGGIFISAGTHYVDGELIMQHGQTIAGVSPDLSIIRAHTTFPFTSSGEVAIMHGTRSGSGNTSYANGGPLSRYFLRDFYVSGENLTNSNGILASLQQPASWNNVRADNCAGLYGICAGGQDFKFYNIECLGNAVGLRLRGASIASLHGINIEDNSATRHLVIENNVGGVSFAISVLGLHIEGTATDAIGVDVSGGATGLSFHNVWCTNPDTGTLFKFDTASANPGANCRYVLSNVRCNNPQTTFKIVDDVQRSFTRTSTEADRMIMFLVAHNSSAPTYYDGA